MGRARQHINAASICERRDPFAGVLGSGRGGGAASSRADTPAVVATDNTAGAQALSLLDTIITQHFGEEHDPDGIWGLSEEGWVLLAEVEDQLESSLVVSAAHDRPLRRLHDFREEY